MIEKTGDIFVYPADAIVIPTNCIQHRGLAVMGGGVALAAAKRWPWMPAALGKHLAERDPDNIDDAELNLFQVTPEVMVVAFPTKLNYKNDSDLYLIENMAMDLADAIEGFGWKACVSPRLGCGLGGLDWDEVGPLLAEILDDRFIVLTP